MNDKFYILSEERQQKIINAGYLVFSRSTYKKSPVQEVADSAGISKSLLFHYFRNKKEFYLFLWEKACETTLRYLAEYKCYEPCDLFEMMERGMRAKVQIMYRYPHMTAFVVKAFYESDVEISSEIQKSYRKHFSEKAREALDKLDPGDFIPGLDIGMMYREMYLASEGYLWEVYRQGGDFDAARLEADFQELLSFWKKIYLRK